MLLDRFKAGIGTTGRSLRQVRSGRNRFMINYEKHEKDQQHEAEHTIVAVFESRAEARSAIAALHKAKYTHTWLGTTSIAETAGGDETLTVETSGFFAGSQSLVDALVSHGVSGNTARSLDGRMEPGNALLTINPKDKDPGEAIVIVERNGGRVGGMASSSWEPWSSPPSGGDSAMYGDEDFDEIVFVYR
jgi:hypothetical protein